MLMPLDCHLFSCGVEINAAKVLFNTIKTNTLFAIFGLVAFIEQKENDNNIIAR